MAKRHQALFDDVLSGLDNGDAEPAEKMGEGVPQRARPAAGSRFLKRSTGIADRLSGEVLEQTLRWVDPARCRMWARHNRRYDLLSEQRCADLIEGFKAQGRQEFPAIVRKVEGYPDHDYEVICGARRHWTVSWLRARNYSQFKFLIDVRGLTDEEAFRLADVENREREDVSDYERACDYADALARYYDGRQKDMAARLEVSESWLSRWLLMAKLPKLIVDAYADPTQVKERHARDLRPLLATKAGAQAINAAAAELAETQARRRGAGQGPIDGAAVFAKLKAAAKPKALKRKPTAPAEYRDDTGRLVAKAKAGKGGGLTLEIAGGAGTAAAHKAAVAAIAAHFGDK